MTREGQRLEILIRALEARLKALASTGGLATPAHATTHESGGTDPIQLDDLAAPDDNTDLDASTTTHGLMPKWTLALISALLDLISATRGALLYRGAAAWAALTPGAAGKVLTSNGAAADPSWETAGSSGITQLTGDVTAGPGSGSQAATIANDAVTNAKAANMAQSTIKGRAAAAGTGDPTDLTPNEVSTVLDGATDPFLRTSALPAAGARYASFGVTFDGAGLPLTAGMKDYGRYLHGNGTIVNVTILSTDAAATAGSVVIDIWKEGTFASYPPTDADSITGGNEPELASANHSEDTTLASYTTVAMTRGDLWAFNIDSCTGITKCSIQVNVLLT